LRNPIKLYADDSKIISINNTPQSHDYLQDDLNAIANWTTLWRMSLNKQKCVVLHFNKDKNPLQVYRLQCSDCPLGYHQLESSTEERDLGVQISHDLSWRKHVQIITSRANSILGRLKRTFICKDPHTWKQLYTSLVRPHLEYAAPVWNPMSRGDVKSLEKIQDRATKAITCLKRLSPDRRLNALNLTSLEVRRERGDLIQQFKFIKGIEQINWLSPQQSRVGAANQIETRGHSHRIVKDNFSAAAHNNHAKYISTRLEFFSNRVVNSWNQLPQIAINSANLNDFKRIIDTPSVKSLIAKSVVTRSL
jgi:hypothetical protein